MHWIQYHILDQLINHKSRRFSELRAGGVESNLFQYHLRHIARKGYVEKTDAGYQLSPKGLYFADRLSSSLKQERKQPKIISIALLQNSRGLVLLHRGMRQPFIDTLRLPAGKVHDDEPMRSAALRELDEKIGIRVGSVEYVGSLHVRIYAGDQLVSEYYGFVHGGVYEGDLPKNCTWYDPSMDLHDLMPSVKEVIQHAISDDKSFREIEVSL